jgi:hypothetical protein
MLYAQHGFLGAEHVQVVWGRTGRRSTHTIVLSRSSLKLQRLQSALIESGGSRHGKGFKGALDPVHVGAFLDLHSMAKGKAISLAKFASCFDKAWMVPRGGHQLDRRVKKDDLVKLPWRIGKATFWSSNDYVGMRKADG